MEQQRSNELSYLEALQPEIIETAKCSMVGPDKTWSLNELIRGMENMLSQTRDVKACTHILNTLRFEEMDMRRENISGSHYGTYNWVFTKAELVFKDWLESKNGVFWITGKPGSGKSTLMKHILHHPSTSELLKKWAGKRPLIIAYHYFWNAGTSMQKSRLGLLRTLLYHIVLNCPDLALNSVPPRFHEGPATGVMPWTFLELCTTLEACGKQARQTARLCFFIDGLDESQEEHADLIDLISNLNERAGIKVCVSSRPWNVFSCAYNKQTDGQLTMQELTGHDIKLYVTDKMTKHPRFAMLRAANKEGCDKLAEEVNGKAQGVFLWVFLVIRSLLRGLNNDDDLDILRLRLHEYPETLDGYFSRMFDRIEKIYRRHSSRILLVALKSEGALVLSAPRYLELEIANPDYALDLPISSKIDCTWEDSDCGAAVPDKVVSSRYLDARCADLLEISGAGINFLHRTAKDFLALSFMQTRLFELAGEDFELALSLARLDLAQIKSLNENGPGLNALLHHLLNIGASVQEGNVAGFIKVLDDLDANGDIIFENQHGPIPYRKETEDGMALVSDGSSSYVDSIQAFQISAALIRLRKRQGKKCEPPGEVPHDGQSDAQLLFGLNGVEDLEALNA